MAIDRLLLDGISSLCYRVIQCLTPPPTSIELHSYCIRVHLSAFTVRSRSHTLRVRFALISSYCFLAVAFVVVIVTVQLVVIVIAVANVVST